MACDLLYLKIGNKYLIEIWVLVRLLVYKGEGVTIGKEKMINQNRSIRQSPLIDSSIDENTTTKNCFLFFLYEQLT